MNNQALEISVSEWVGKRENFNVFICVFLLLIRCLDTRCWTESWGKKYTNVSFASVLSKLQIMFLQHLVSAQKHIKTKTACKIKLLNICFFLLWVQRSNNDVKRTHRNVILWQPGTRVIMALAWACPIFLAQVPCATLIVTRKTVLNI